MFRLSSACCMVAPLIGVAIVFLAICAQAADGQPDSLRVMPLGDSITEAQGGFSGYRYWLWKDIEAAGYPVNLVGGMNGVWNGEPSHTDYDQDHEGHWGWRADQILAQIGSWAEAAQPDVVLLHLGHNDLWQDQSIASTIDELGQIIDAVRVVNPEVTLFLAQVIPSIPGTLDSIPAFNDQIPFLAMSKHTAESPVLVVDHETGYDPWQHSYDSVHPNEAGEKFMAYRWLVPLELIIASISSVERPPTLSFEVACYPNPFNPQTTIAFEIPKRESVSLRVFDLSGRLVKELVGGEEFIPGRHEVVWNGRDEAGRQVASGTYFYRLEAGTYSETKRMVLIK